MTILTSKTVSQERSMEAVGTDGMGSDICAMIPLQRMSCTCSSAWPGGLERRQEYGEEAR